MAETNPPSGKFRFNRLARLVDMSLFIRPSTPSLLGATAAALAALLPMLWLWGFTVDDALISARVAHQLAIGNGYRFNASGPMVDAVTPLGWAPLLAWFARTGPTAALNAAKWLGASAWLLAASWLGSKFVELGRRALLVGTVALAFTGPLAAWAVAGMETGLVIALCTFALSFKRWSQICLGLAAAWRPELLPWAMTMALGSELGRAGPTDVERLRSGLVGCCWAVGPFILVALLRTALFSVAYPLAAVAKPADLASGLRYALGALALSGPAWLVVGGPSLRRLSWRSRVAIVAGLVHALALIIVGGDWMVFYRLFAPALPALILAGAELAEQSSVVALGIRLSFSLTACLLLDAGLGPAARKIGRQRAELIAVAQPLLAGAHRVATVDVGWVGAATTADLIDLAGVTDPLIAALPGGHTSKRLPQGLLESREVEALVLLARAPKLEDWPELEFVRAVEVRVVNLASADSFRAVGLVPLLGTNQAYVIARRAAHP